MVRPLVSEGVSLFEQLSSLRTEDDVIAHRQQVIDFLRASFSALGYRRASAAMDLLLDQKGDTLRRDGKTPSVLHEISQALYTLGMIDTGYLNPSDPITEQIFCLNFTHDLGEEYGQRNCPVPRNPTHGDMKKAYLRWYINEMEQRLGQAATATDARMAMLSWRMAKTFGAHKLYASTAEYYAVMLRHPATIAAKLFDRIHNESTRIGADEPGKLLANIAETREIYGPYVRIAKVRYPRYAAIYDFSGKLIARQTRLMEHSFGIQPGPAFIESPRHEFNVASAFTLPRGFNPIYMIESRLQAAGKAYHYDLQPWHPALERGLEL